MPVMGYWAPGDIRWCWMLLLSGGGGHQQCCQTSKTAWCISAECVRCGAAGVLCSV